MDEEEIATVLLEKYFPALPDAYEALQNEDETHLP